MAFSHSLDVSSITPERLYDLYLDVAGRDHQFRIASQYGDSPPRTGHCEFRPLSAATFVARVNQYDSMDNEVGLALRKRLSRQAIAYGVDLPAYVNQASTSLQRAA